MKDITSTINESAELKYKPNFNLRDDIYNVLAELAFEYDQARKSSFDDKREVAAALDWFMEKFFDE